MGAARSPCCSQGIEARGDYVPLAIRKVLSSASRRNDRARWNFRKVGREQAVGVEQTEEA